jgi:hypothetical protein
MNSVTAPAGIMTASLIKAPPLRDLTVDEIKHYGFPHKGLNEEVADWRAQNHSNFLRGFEKVRIALENDIPHFYGRLWVKHFKADGSMVDYGLVSMRVVTTVGVNYIVDAFQNIVELEAMKYHAIGITNTAEAVGDTAMASELTTQYNPDNTRATGSTTEGATANIYRTVGTNTVDATVSIVEHGIFNQAATGGGTLLDRSIFATISMGSGDSLQTTYDLTFTAGS